MVKCGVVDGDTLYCGPGKLVRLRGLFAPEIGEPEAEVYTERLRQIMASGQVRLVEQGFRDRYHRTIVDLYVDGRRIRQHDIGPRAGIGSWYRETRTSHAMHRFNPSTGVLKHRKKSHQNKDTSS